MSTQFCLKTAYDTRECGDINFSYTIADVRKNICIYIYIYVHHIQAAQEKIMGRNDRLSVGLMNWRLLAQPF
jgi:hypothetical protein